MCAILWHLTVVIKQLLVQWAPSASRIISAVATQDFNPDVSTLDSSGTENTAQRRATKIFRGKYASECFLVGWRRPSERVQPCSRHLTSTPTLRHWTVHGTEPVRALAMTLVGEATSEQGFARGLHRFEHCVFFSRKQLISPTHTINTAHYSPMC